MPGIGFFFGASSSERVPTARVITHEVEAFKGSAPARQVIGR